MKKQKPLLIIIIKFFSIYIILSGVYYFYLKYYNFHLSTCDPMTMIVSKLSSRSLSLLSNEEFVTIYRKGDNFTYIYSEGSPLSRIIEGCNAISIFILYIAFILSFAKNLKKTLVYLGVTLLILFLLNILRINLINLVIKNHKEYAKITHDYIFPSIMYFAVIFFWIIWLKKIVTKNEKS